MDLRKTVEPVLAPCTGCSKMSSCRSLLASEVGSTTRSRYFGAALEYRQTQPSSYRLYFCEGCRKEVTK